MFNNSEMRMRLILAAGLLIFGLWIQAAQNSGTSKAQAKVGAPASLSQPAPRKSGSSGLVATDPASINLASGMFQIVEFYKPDDPASQSTALMMRRFGEKYQGKVNIIYVDITDHRYQEIKDRLNFIFYPQFALVDGQGRLRAQWSHATYSEMELTVAEAAIGHPLP